MKALSFLALLTPNLTDLGTSAQIEAEKEDENLEKWDGSDALRPFTYFDNFCEKPIDTKPVIFHTNIILIK